ncbi:hypothetical protein ASG73_07175 [Janibacter sp. Soil728]|uniref:GNAT family N-acetyltransferase n=1 Tax=Janibacter sp. Soil728 TaxID=1736393 RepID=UPI0007016189|nr:GNAT family N-acetyltransferase [Janibacter sp. Soil728]KRE37457.1 hypothetical protein ASG73_07175 [Janibacter sp. Soil728]
MDDGWGVRRLCGDDWERHRAVRLAMLLDQPGAYGSTFAREVAFDETTWRERLDHPVLLAESDAGLPLGAATLYRPDESHDPEIVAMWVAGHARGHGIADALVQACVDLAGARGDAVVRLHVMRDNPRAVAFYERVGFAFDGSAGDIAGCDRMSRVLPA